MTEAKDLPTEMQRSLRRIAWASVILTTVAVFCVLYFARTLFIPITLACVLALLLAPLVRRLDRLGSPRPVSSGILVVLSALLCVLLVERIAQPASDWLSRVPEAVVRARVVFRHFVSFLRDVEKVTKDVAEMSNGGGGAEQKVVVDRPGLTEAFLSSTGQALIVIAVTFVLLYFLLVFGDLFVRKTVAALPNMRDKKRTLSIARDMQSVVSRYLLTVSAINICLGFATGIAMGLLGVPDAILWGVMAAVFNFMPYLGAILTATTIALISLVSFTSVSEMIVPPLVFLGLTMLEGQIITPSVVGRQLRLNPVIVFIFMIAWGWVWGIAGVLLAVPLLVIFKILCDHIEGLNVIGQYLSLEPPGETARVAAAQN